MYCTSPVRVTVRTSIDAKLCTLREGPGLAAVSLCMLGPAVGGGRYLVQGRYMSGGEETRLLVG